jgi:hypothetical protein
LQQDRNKKFEKKPWKVGHACCSSHSESSKESFKRKRFENDRPAKPANKQQQAAKPPSAPAPANPKSAVDKPKTQPSKPSTEGKPVPKQQQQPEGGLKLEDVLYFGGAKVQLGTFSVLLR